MDIISKVLPIIFLFLVGVFLNRSKFVRPETMQDIKKIVINISLPAVLFLVFSKVSLQPGYFLIVVIVFIGCILALVLGGYLRKVLGMPSPFFPALLTGFEAGMMGYAIFGTVYGMENLYKFGIADLGQASFVFLVLVPMLEQQAAGRAKKLLEIILTFFKSPIILAILLGIIASQSGFAVWMRNNSLTESILKTLELLAALTTPLIAMIIGYEMRLHLKNLARPLETIIVRMLIWIPFGLLLNYFVVDHLLHLDRTFQAAIMTMMILPPPFVIPLFMNDNDKSGREYVVNTLSLATLITLITFSIVSVIYHP